MARTAMNVCNLPGNRREHGSFSTLGLVTVPLTTTLLVVLLSRSESLDLAQVGQATHIHGVKHGHGVVINLRRQPAVSCHRRTNT